MAEALVFGKAVQLQDALRAFFSCASAPLRESRIFSSKSSNSPAESLRRRESGSADTCTSGKSVAKSDYYLVAGKPNLLDAAAFLVLS